MNEEKSNIVQQQANTQAKPAKVSNWSWVLPAAIGYFMVKFFGLVGGLISVGSYFLLKPKIGMWGAIAAAGVIGIVAALGLAAIIRS
jgi:hypothetical protein